MSSLELFHDDRPRFACIVGDPAWPMRGAGRSKRGADRHYDLERVREIPDNFRRSGCFRPADDAHLWLWVTDNFLDSGLWVLSALGFRYVRTMVWVKGTDPGEALNIGLERLSSLEQGYRDEPYIDASDARRVLVDLALAQTPRRGLGRYLRGSHELCLLGVRGSGMSPAARTGYRDVPSVVYGRPTRHSAKPDSAYQAIERVSQGPRIEFHARAVRDGWHAFNPTEGLDGSLAVR